MLEKLPDVAEVALAMQQCTSMPNMPAYTEKGCIATAPYLVSVHLEEALLPLLFRDQTCLQTPHATEHRARAVSSPAGTNSPTRFLQNRTVEHRVAGQTC